MLVPVQITYTHFNQMSGPPAALFDMNAETAALKPDKKAAKLERGATGRETKFDELTANAAPVEQWASPRPPLQQCTQQQFLQDLVDFLVVRCCCSSQAWPSACCQWVAMAGCWWSCGRRLCSGMHSWWLASVRRALCCSGACQSATAAVLMTAHQRMVLCHEARHCCVVFRQTQRPANIIRLPGCVQQRFSWNIHYAEFPNAVLNGVPLDLFNLYRAVVSRGGFKMGNAINWKGEVFTKMANWTADHKMTGVGNALKRHYRKLLWEYERANQKDIAGDHCMLCQGGPEVRPCAAAAAPRCFCSGS